MNCLKNIAASGLTLMLALGAPVAWAQTAPRDACRSAGAYKTMSSTTESASLMDQNLSREIKQAWSQGKNATAAMAFQENGEIALNEGREKEARYYFQAAEHELGTLQADQTSY
jgi:hypothetical protein